MAPQPDDIGEFEPAGPATDDGEERKASRPEGGEGKRDAEESYLIYYSLTYATAVAISAIYLYCWLKKQLKELSEKNQVGQNEPWLQNRGPLNFSDDEEDFQDSDEEGGASPDFPACQL